jgi:hypothetical protein
MATEPEPLPPTVQWEEFWDDQDGLQPGQHVSVFGPTGTGKTYTLLWFCEDFPSHSILVVTKGADEIVGRLVKERGWLLATEVDQILTSDGRPGSLLKKSWGDRWEKRKERPPQRIVFKPTVPAGSVRSRADHLQAAVEALVDRAYEYCAHSKESKLLVAIDETMYAAMELNMEKPLVVIWNEGRSMSLTVAAAMQRPAWIPKSSKSAPTYLIIFDTSDPDDLSELARMLGEKPLTLRSWLDQLPEHHHLLARTRGRGRRVYVSRVVIRKRGGSETETGGSVTRNRDPKVTSGAGENQENPASPRRR